MNTLSQLFPSQASPFASLPLPTHSPQGFVLYTPHWTAAHQAIATAAQTNPNQILNIGPNFQPRALNHGYTHISMMGIMMSKASGSTFGRTSLGIEAEESVEACEIKLVES